ncbi:MAG: tetratricopeptide repeat protein [Gemmatimonadaceae bacterium]|nr:tetratricopeptide repeat protein [Gemmatimonadaceae bacterium]NUR18651.1 tetratricopeptide repeat protein [Gemmatimonadaceae bacterium]NUS97824.1 tetratricopeptide repeat protein [Gemmatimonadaceae bacterium]
MDSASDLVARARERFSVRDYHGAVLLLREAVVEGMAYADAHNLLGLSLALIGRQADAVSSFDAAIALNPRYVEAHLNRAVLLNDMGRSDEAREAFATAEHLGKPDETGFPVMVANRLANAHAGLAADYRAAGALDEAIAQYERALELRPGYADIRLALARALTERGRHGDAGRQLDEVLRVRPEWLDAMLLRGLTAYLDGDLATADTVWTAAAERHPEEPRIEIYRAMLARRRAAG